MSSKDLTEALRKLTEQANGADGGPAPMPARGSAAASKSAALLAGGGSGGASLSGVLTETAYADREWFAAKLKTSSDGLFTMSVRCLKKLKMLDAASNELVMNFKDST